MTNMGSAITFCYLQHSSECYKGDETKPKMGKSTVNTTGEGLFFCLDTPTQLIDHFKHKTTKPYLTYAELR